MKMICSICRQLLYRQPNVIRRLSTKKKLNVDPNSVLSSKNDQLPSKVGLNELGIPMISGDLHRRLFDSDGVRGRKIDRTDLKKIRVKIAKAAGIDENQLTSSSNESDSMEANIVLPDLRGKSLEEHFTVIAEEQVRDYRELALKFANIKLPEMPPKSAWVMKPGWTKYTSSGSPISVDYPEEDAIILDVEICQAAGLKPTLATAVSEKAWYSWCSEALCALDSRMVKALKAAEKSSRLSSEHIGNSTSVNSATPDANESPERIFLNDLIPLESKRGEQENLARRKRLVIGHNVGFDRTFVKEQYFLERTDLRFLDTMSMHIATNGFANVQRAVHLKHKSEAKNNPIGGLNKSEVGLNKDTENVIDWEKEGSMNSLEAVFGHYCKNSNLTLDKSKKEPFITEPLSTVRSQFADCMEYCATDVAATFEVFSVLLPAFLERFKHPVTFGGMMEMSTAYLPVNSSWWYFINAAEEMYKSELGRINRLLEQLANGAVALLKDEKYKDDPWLWDEDWSLSKKLGFYKKAAATKRDPNEAAGEYVKRLWNSFADGKRKAQPYLHELPKWYTKLCPRSENAESFETSTSSKVCDHLLNSPAWGPLEITMNMRIAPKLLRMHYHGYPLHYYQKHGWGYLVPTNDPAYAEGFKEESHGRYWIELSGEKKAVFSLERLKEVIAQNNGTTDDQKHSKPESSGVQCGLPGVLFYKLPHKDGADANVGSPFAKDFLHLLGDVLNSQNPDDAKLLADVNRKCSYWKITRDRIMSQMPVLLYQYDNDGNRIQFDQDLDDMLYGAIIPRVAAAGTVTRRAVEPLWMTASNAKENRIGSEVKGMIQAPPGYVFVGADVDSQELWIASLLGDSWKHKIHGCTPFSWMLLRGNKADGTDQHSMIASELGVTRDEAKILNYGRIYGAGLPFAIILLKKFRPHEPIENIQELARKLYFKTKGRRVKSGFQLTRDGQEMLEEEIKRSDTTSLTRRAAKKLVSNRGLSWDLYCEKEWLVWEGGTESDVFNRLEQIALSNEAATPVLGCRLSRALELGSENKDFLPSRVNWVVQSSAVDYLHLILVCMRWLFDEYNIQGRFSISIHDEVRYLVSESDQYRAALALQITNLLTRAMFVSKMGMVGLPQSVAYFSKVDIDKALRKEVYMDSKTPSNDVGLHKGHWIPTGMALDIHQIIEKTGGRLDKI